MIILDTNVISELMRPEPEQRVIAWFTKQKPANLMITALTIAEIERGIERLPNGNRKETLRKSFNGFIDSAFSGRILPFDTRAATLYGSIAAEREKMGFNTDALDLMIAATAKQHGATIATRNTKDFEGCGLNLQNPWDTSS